ncbi:MAG: tetratricopeptide repeat protein [Acidobacteria bacterium]|nr:tetratricopeptide repeat protein [Acidobacteriota bacterium]
MKYRDVHFISLSILFCIISVSCNQKNMVTENSVRIEQIRQIFIRLEAQGVDLRTPHLFGYFFFDKERHGLERLSEEVLKNGYTVVSLEQIEDGKFRLHVEKIESHTPESLYQRGLAFTEIATKYSVDVYDGFDVGNPDPTRALVTDESFLTFMKTKTKSELFAFGDHLLDLEIYDRAEQVFRECIDQEIRPQESTHSLSFALLEQNKTDEAIYFLETAVKEFPDHLKMRFNLAATYYELGNFQKSIEHYQVAAQLSPDDSSIIYGIAASQFGFGQFAESQDNCRKILALDPDHEYAKTLLKQLEERK